MGLAADERVPPRGEWRLCTCCVLVIGACFVRQALADAHIRKLGPHTKSHAVPWARPGALLVGALFSPTLRLPCSCRCTSTSTF